MLAFGTVLKMARKSAGIKAQDLARQLGVTPTNYSMWECGRAMPNFDNILKTLEAINLSLSRFFRLVEMAYKKKFIKQDTKSEWGRMVSRMLMEEENRILQNITLDDVQSGITTERYEELRKQGATNDAIAKMYGYASGNSLSGTIRARKRRERHKKLMTRGDEEGMRREEAA